MSNRIRFLALLAAAGLLAAACSSTAATASPSMSTAPSESASAPASESPSASMASESPSASVAASESPAASASALTGADLTGAIPTTVGSKTVTVKTAKPSDLPLLTGDTGKAALTDLLTRLKVTDSTVQAAIGTTSDKSITIGALSVPGADPTLLSLFFFSSTQPGTPVAITPTTISGKNVSLFGSAGKTGQVYVYITGSTVFIVQTADQSLASDAIGKLP